MLSLHAISMLPHVNILLRNSSHSVAMSFHKPFTAAPVKLGAYHVAQKRKRAAAQILRSGGLALAIGTAVGGISALYQNGYLDNVVDKSRNFAVDSGLVRARQPAAGDYWSGCNAARDAGVAPLYSWEPGYREGMDGDLDGIACETRRR